MDLASLLDNLTRQVPAREVSISVACSKIETHINALNREDARSLRHALPSLLKLLLGSPETVGWIELLNADTYTYRADSQAFLKLLSPKGLLFSALLSQVPDLGFFYEVSGKNFPVVTRRIIEIGQLDLLPTSVYEGRLVKNIEGHVLRLNMVEYFLFYFLYVLSSSNDGNISGIKKHFPLINSTNLNLNFSPRNLMKQFGITSGTNLLSFHWQGQASSEVYLTLLKEYLVFMVPGIVPQLANPSITPPENILTTLLLKSSSPIWSRVDTGCRYSSFFTGILVEFWLNSYGYALDEQGNPYSDPDFVLPSADFLQALQVVAAHYSSVYALSISPNAPAAFVDPAYKSLATESFSQIRLSFYRYLRVAISVWPVDGTLNLLIEVWMHLISPWCNLDPQAFTESNFESSNFLNLWRPFVVSSFFLYQSLYCQFFNFSASALEGFLLSGDCEDLNEAISKLGALASCLLEIMNPLLAVTPILKKLEVEVEVLKSSNFIRFPSVEVSEINEQLRILEPESFKPRSLFDSALKLSICKIILALDTLNVGIFRKFRQQLNSLNNNNKKDKMNFSFSSSSDSFNFDFENDFENESEARESLYNFVLENPKISVELKSLAKWTLQLRQDFSSVFQLQIEDFKNAKEALKNNLRPFISQPSQLKIRGIKGPLPRAQLKYKLSIIPSTFDSDGLIRSYEFAPLVPVLRNLSSFLTNLTKTLILERIENQWNVKLPRRIWDFKFNLRFFAAYPNILFILLVWMLLRILIKFFF